MMVFLRAATTAVAVLLIAQAALAGGYALDAVRPWTAFVAPTADP